jgi:hypothetical protein
MVNLYRNESSYPKINAQRNLQGRTHYVDDASLRWHKSRVLSARIVNNGLFFAITTSDALDPNNMRRGFRYVVFDIFGNTLERPKLEDAFRTHAQCVKAMWKILDSISNANAKQITREALQRHQASLLREMAQIELQIDAIDETITA